MTQYEHKVVPSFSFENCTVLLQENKFLNSITTRDEMDQTIIRNNTDLQLKIVYIKDVDDFISILKKSNIKNTPLKIKIYTLIGT